MLLAAENAGFLAEALAGVLPPVLLAAAFLAAAWRPWRAPETGVAGPRQRASLAPALGLAFAATYVATHGWPPLALSVGVKQGLFYVALASAILGAREGWDGAPRRLARVLFSLALPLYLLDFMRDYHWSGMESVGWNALIFALVLALWIAAEGQGRRPGLATPLAWVLLTSATAGALHFAGSASLAQLCGGLSAALGVVTVLAWRRPELVLSPAGSTAFVPLFAGLLLAGHYAAELGTASTLLCGGAPLLAVLAEKRVPASRPRLRAVLRVAVTAAPAALALGLELAGRTPDPYAGY